MNCRTAQEKITDSFSASSVLPREVIAHRDSCAQCRAFYEAERDLFESLNNSLRKIVNQPVPPSLLPQVRARLDSAPVSALLGTLQQRLVAIAAVLILSLYVGYLNHRPQIAPDAQDHGAPVSSDLSSPAPAVPAPVEPTTPSPELARRNVSSPRGSQPAAEVIVSSEERRALVRFIARAPEQNGDVAPLTHSEPLNEDPPEEIASVDLGRVEIQPLEAEARE
jgi:hypothetical protein